MTRFFNRLGKWLNWDRRHTALILMALIIFSSYATIRALIGDYMIINHTQRIGGVSTSLGENSDTLLATQKGIKTYADALVFSTGNPLGVMSIASAPGLGTVIADGHTVGAEDTMRSSGDAALWINWALRNHSVGQVVIIPPGDWVIHTPIDTFNTKQHIVWCFGRIHCNKHGGFKIYPNVGGPDLHHEIADFETLIGRENIPYNVWANWAGSGQPTAGTGPDWYGVNQFVGNGVELGNCNRNHFMFAKIQGFWGGISFRVGNGGGCEENTWAFQKIEDCVRGIDMLSLNGHSFCDRNVFTGINGGICRIQAHIAWYIDGYKDSSYIGEFGNNVAQNMMVAKCDSGFLWNGFCDQNILRLHLEPGDKTGTYSLHYLMFKTINNTPYRSTIFNANITPNNVRNTRFENEGFMYVDMLTDSIGATAMIQNVPIYYRGSPYGVVGRNAATDANGVIILQAEYGITQTQVAALPGIFRVVPNPLARMDWVSISSSTYTVATGVGNIKYTVAGTLTLPSAASWPTRVINVYNTYSADLAVTGQSNVLAGKMGSYTSDGVNWLASGDGGGSGGSGSNAGFTASSAIWYSSAFYGFGTTTPTARLDIAGGSATANTGGLKIRANSAPPAVAENDLFFNYGGNLMWSRNGQMVKILDETNFANVSGKTGLPLFGNLIVVSDANYTVGAFDQTILYSVITTTRTLTLPDPTLNKNREVEVRNATAAGSVTLSYGVYTAVGTSSTTLVHNAKVKLKSDGTQWWVIDTSTF